MEVELLEQIPKLASASLTQAYQNYWSQNINRKLATEIWEEAWTPQKEMHVVETAFPGPFQSGAPENLWRWC